MIYHQGVPLRRILRVPCDQFLIERTDRKTFVVSLSRIGADEGVEEVLRTAQAQPGQILRTHAR
jgi:hypothetical protein